MFKYADVFMMVKQALDAGVYDIPQRFKPNQPKVMPRPGRYKTPGSPVETPEPMPKTMPKPGIDQPPQGTPAQPPKPSAGPTQGLQNPSIKPSPNMPQTPPYSDSPELNRRSPYYNPSRFYKTLYQLYPNLKPKDIPAQA